MKRTFVDPWSSAAYFDGWKRQDRKYVPTPGDGTPPVAAATIWLLTAGWRKHRPLISVAELPGPRPAQ